VATDAGILDVAAAAEAFGPRELAVDPATFLHHGDRLLAPLRGLVEAADGPFLDGAPWDTPVQAPRKILCVGLNYRRHAEETGKSAPAEPVLFAKFPNALAPHGAVVDTAGLTQVDFEAELAVVIGRTGKRLREEEALDHVLGYAVANDVSERDLQKRSGQWLLGKTVDGFLPIGPYLVTRDEVPNPQALRIRGWRNDELRQDSDTADMIFSVREIVAYVSRTMTLSPGDVILTGTPEGVLTGDDDPDWIRAGDTYAIEIDGLGRLETRFA
jgi:2-keto-4-pentenoate hydratase/2-oxohepta-3-ene-1,7-dioic acid hydratase in catechol pathway